jgi:hypothetical protein
LCFRDPETLKKCKNKKQSGKVLIAHLKKLLNAVPAVAPHDIDSVEQRGMIMELNETPSRQRDFESFATSKYQEGVVTLKFLLNFIKYVSTAHPCTKWLK